jgi:hypothetical protein
MSLKELQGPLPGVERAKDKKTSRKMAGILEAVSL